VAYNGTSFLVVWTIKGTRVSAEGAVLDPVGIKLASRLSACSARADGGALAGWVIHSGLGEPGPWLLARSFEVKLF